MPYFKFEGSAPVRYGTQKVKPGDVIQASGLPGENYVEVPNPNEQPEIMPNPKEETNTYESVEKPSKKKKSEVDNE